MRGFHFLTTCVVVCVGVLAWSSMAGATPITYHTELRYEAYDPDTGSLDAWADLVLELDFDTDDVAAFSGSNPDSATFNASAVRLDIVGGGDWFLSEGSFDGVGGTARVWYMDTGMGGVLPFLDFAGTFDLGSDWEIAIATTMDVISIPVASSPDLIVPPIYSAADVGSGGGTLSGCHLGSDPTASYGFSDDLTMVTSYTVLRQDGDVVPEPATAVLVALGMGGMALLRRRRC